MKKKLLVADDDETIRRAVTRVFAGTAWEVEGVPDGAAALETVSACAPDVILLDLNMPRLGGRELLARLRANPRLDAVPVIVLSGDDAPEEKAAELRLGADDFVSKPFSPVELVSRVERAASRNSRMLAANPLTLLPGGPAIEEEAVRRIRAGAPLAFFYIDIDNFKPYNDKYGYLCGDEAIRRAAALLRELQAAFSGEEVFVGHIGGDDFVLISRPARAEELARELASRFDALSPQFYNAEDRARGFTVSKDRLGAAHEFPLMALTIALTTNERRTLDHYAKIADIAAEIKKYLKGRPRRGSRYLKDRRSDEPWTPPPLRSS